MTSIAQHVHVEIGNAHDDPAGQVGLLHVDKHRQERRVGESGATLVASLASAAGGAARSVAVRAIAEPMPSD